MITVIGFCTINYIDDSKKMHLKMDIEFHGKRKNAICRKSLVKGKKNKIVSGIPIP